MLTVENVVAGYGESSGAIVFTSPVIGVADGVEALDCCGSGAFAEASGFLSPHIYPPWACVAENKMTGSPNVARRAKNGNPN